MNSSFRIPHSSFFSNWLPTGRFDALFMWLLSLGLYLFFGKPSGIAGVMILLNPLVIIFGPFKTRILYSSLTLLIVLGTALLPGSH